MKVVLLRSVKYLGHPGDVREVADGYARNYLMPQSLAAVATHDQVRRLSEVAAHKERERTQAQKGRRQTLKRLAGRRFTVRVAKANKQGTLFAAVTVDELSAILKREGYEVPPAAMKLFEPIKHIGEHAIEVDFGALGRTKVIINVVVV